MKAVGLQLFLRQTEKLIAPYVQKDPTAFCSYEDHQLAGVGDGGRR